MTEDHLQALLAVAEAKKDERGFSLPEGRSLTLYVSSGNAGLTVSRIQSVKLDKGLVHAQTSKGERFVLALPDCFAGSVDASQSGGRKAGFQ